MDAFRKWPVGLTAPGNFSEYADDTNLFFTGKNEHELEIKINGELKCVHEWLTSNKLSLNVSKTNYIIFRSRNHAIQDINININKTLIDRVYSVKFLGVHLDLSWKTHIQYICKTNIKIFGCFV